MKEDYKILIKKRFRLVTMFAQFINEVKEEFNSKEHQIDYITIAVIILTIIVVMIITHYLI